MASQCFVTAADYAKHLLCAFCHQLVSGAVNERYVITGTEFIVLDGRERIDARAPIQFERVA